MGLTSTLYSFCFYLIHPLRAHDFINQDLPNSPSGFQRLSVYESLFVSWFFVILGGLFRLILVLGSLSVFNNLLNSSDLPWGDLVSTSGTSGFYMILFTSFLDIIFYPLFGIFLIQIWEFFIKTYAYLLGESKNVKQKVDSVLAVSLSSKVLLVIPFIGGFLEGIANMILIFVGLKKQFKMNSALAICVLLTPYVFFLGLSCLIIFSFVLMFQ